MLNANIKNELIWWTALAVLSALFIGFATHFRFNTLEIQIHSTYYVIGPLDGIGMVTGILILGRSIYVLTDILADQYLVVAAIIVIVNAIAGLFVLRAIYRAVQRVITESSGSLNGDLTSYFLIFGVLVGILIAQAVVEIRMIKKLQQLARDR